MIRAQIFEYAATIIQKRGCKHACVAIHHATNNWDVHEPHHKLFTDVYLSTYGELSGNYISSNDQPWLNHIPEMREVLLRELALNLRAQGFSE